MASPAKRPTRRRRGNIEWLPSGSARVKVYAGIDPVSHRQLYIRELVRPKRTTRATEREAEKVLTKLLSQVDERRNPRTNATVNQLLDRWLDVIEVERTTRINYVGKIPFSTDRRAIMPAITTLTIRLRRHPLPPAFLLHWRDPARVATAGGTYDVVPAGEFQPSSVALWDRRVDFDLWRNIVREYAEELLGAPEHDGTRSAPIDYAS